MIRYGIPLAQAVLNVPGEVCDGKSMFRTATPELDTCHELGSVLGVYSTNTAAD